MKRINHQLNYVILVGISRLSPGFARAKRAYLSRLYVTGIPWKKNTGRAHPCESYKRSSEPVDQRLDSII